MRSVGVDTTFPCWLRPVDYILQRIIFNSAVCMTDSHFDREAIILSKEYRSTRVPPLLAFVGEQHNARGS